MPISPCGGHACVHPPQVVVRSSRSVGALNDVTRDALRVHAGEHGANRAVLARRVHALQHQQQAAPLLGPQPVLQQLQLVEELAVAQRGGRLVGEPEPVARITLRDSGGRPGKTRRASNM